METDYQMCVHCNKEFDYLQGGHVTEGFIYSCADCHYLQWQDYFKNKKKGA